MRPMTSCVAITSLGVAVTILLATVPAMGQAWTPRKGSGSGSLSYQYTWIDEHLFPGGETLDLGQIYGQSVFAEGELGITNRLAVTGRAAFVLSRFDDETGEFYENLELDDGDYHGGIQDLGVGLRYRILAAPVVLTPSVSANIPSHDYVNFGHAARGNNLAEARFGVNVGRALTLFKPGFFHASYEYGWVENVADVSNDRSIVTAALGVFLSTRFQVSGFGLYNYTHDGLAWSEHDLHEDNFHLHDAAAAAEYWRVGGSASFLVNHRLSLSLGYSTTLDGENTHDANAITFGTSYNFAGLFR